MSYIFSLEDTWNNPTTEYVGVGMDVNDTGSAAGSALLDLKINGDTKIFVDKNGMQILSKGVGVFNKTPPAAQPVVPTTVTELAQTIQQYGFFQAGPIPDSLAGISTYQVPNAVAADRTTPPIPADAGVTSWSQGSLIFRDVDGVSARQIWIVDDTTTGVTSLLREDLPDCDNPLTTMPDLTAGWVVGDFFSYYNSTDKIIERHRVEDVGGTLVAVMVDPAGNSGSGGGAGTSFDFLSLSDTPNSYGTAGQAIVVNSTGDGFSYEVSGNLVPQPGWVLPTGYTVDRDLDIGTLQDVTRVLQTLIADLKAANVLLN